MLKVGRDLLILVVIGNILSILVISEESFTFRMVLVNAIPSIGVGYPLFKGIELI
nr:hypothetical protein [Bacteroidota bacterium]